MMPFTPSHVAEFAPDAASFKAAQELAAPAKWQHLTADREGARGEHQGSGAAPYRARVLFDNNGAPAFDCSCPSRKRPCKHALALLLLHAQHPAAFVPGDSALPAPSSTPAPAAKADDADITAPGSLFGPPLDEMEDDGMDASALPADWQQKLGREFSQPYFSKLRAFVCAERAAHTIYPPPADVFNAFGHTPYQSARVLILGQDPYHGPRQAHGLAFSVQPKVATPPSLQNIFLELRDELGCRVPNNGFLVPWAQQGVMLLNAVLTVRRGEANSHKGQGWEKFTDAAIGALNEKPERVVFVLWGAYARKKKALIDTTRHTVVESAHPSPLSAHTGFFGSKPFSQVNRALRDAGQVPVEWQIPNL